MYKDIWYQKWLLVYNQIIFGFLRVLIGFIVGFLGIIWGKEKYCINNVYLYNLNNLNFVLILKLFIIKKLFKINININFKCDWM